MACAALAADRVAAAGVVSGVTDFGWPGAWDGYLEAETTLMRIGDEAKGTEWCEARYGPDGGRFMETGVGELAPADQVALTDETFATGLILGARGLPTGRRWLCPGHRAAGQAVVV